MAASRFAAKLRAAFGNGGKAPTLYQRFSEYGAPNLLPQSNVGGEVGIDQKLFNDRLTLSATAYDAFYRNLSRRTAIHELGPDSAPPKPTTAPREKAAPSSIHEIDD